MSSTGTRKSSECEVCHMIFEINEKISLYILTQWLVHVMEFVSTFSLLTYMNNTGVYYYHYEPVRNTPSPYTKTFPIK